MVTVKSARLFFQEGSSDKLYNADIVEDDEGLFTVKVAWGRRGAKLNTGKKALRVSLKEAERAFDKVVRDKTKKGYEEISEEVQPAEVAPPVGEGSGSTVATTSASSFTPSGRTRNLLINFSGNTPRTFLETFCLRRSTKGILNFSASAMYTSRSCRMPFWMRNMNSAGSLFPGSRRISLL